MTSGPAVASGTCGGSCVFTGTPRSIAQWGDDWLWRIPGPPTDSRSLAARDPSAIQGSNNSGALTALPQDAQEHPYAGGDQQRLDRLFLNVRFQALFPLLCHFAALIVIFPRLTAELLILLPRLIAHLPAQIAQVLSDFCCLVGQVGGAGIRIVAHT